MTTATLFWCPYNKDPTIYCPNYSDVSDLTRELRGNRPEIRHQIARCRGPNPLAQFLGPGRQGKAGPGLAGQAWTGQRAGARPGREKRPGEMPKLPNITPKQRGGRSFE